MQASFRVDGRAPADIAMPELRLIDSITELLPGDAGCVVVCGSHGGISVARYALAVRPALCVFNDAGGGKDGAGLAALALLQQQGLAACAVAHTSARIGDAQSTLNDGVISHANALALHSGISVGRTCREALEDFRRQT